MTMKKKIAGASALKQNLTKMMMKKKIVRASALEQNPTKMTMEKKLRGLTPFNKI